ncbi:hypothetical protein ABFS83_10G115000 [Erythranthe nasuta]
MVKTRNQRVAAMFNSDDWPVEYDDFMMANLDYFSLPFDTLADGALMNSTLEVVAAEMHRTYGRVFTNEEIKRRTQIIHNRYRAFVDFLHLPGVSYNRRTNVVTVETLFDDPLSHRKKSRKQLMNNYFRANGFPYFDTCELIFDENEAGRIDFVGGQGNHVLDHILVDAGYLSDDTSTDESYNDEQFAYDNFMANQFPNENPWEVDWDAAAARWDAPNKPNDVVVGDDAVPNENDGELEEGDTLGFNAESDITQV